MSDHDDVRGDYDDDDEAIETLLGETYIGMLTEWEIEFLESVEMKGIRTPTQREYLDKIWREVVVTGNRK